MIAIIASFIAALSFAITISAPKSEWMRIGTVAAIAWFIKIIVLNVFHVSQSLALLIASASIAVCSIFLAKKRRKPTSVYNIPAVFPLVPGITAFQTMEAFMNQSFYLGLELLLRTIRYALSIAFGIVFIELLHRSFKKLQTRKNL